MASNVSSNPFATVGASWMDELMDGNDGGKMVWKPAKENNLTAQLCITTCVSTQHPQS